MNSRQQALEDLCLLCLDLKTDQPTTVLRIIEQVEKIGRLSTVVAPASWIGSLIETSGNKVVAVADWKKPNKYIGPYFSNHYGNGTDLVLYSAIFSCSIALAALIACLFHVGGL